MMSRSRLIFIVFFLTGVLLTVIGLRAASSRVFYKFRIAYVTQHRLKQQLWQKRLELESLLSPAVVSEGAGEKNRSK